MPKRVANMAKLPKAARAYSLFLLCCCGLLGLLSQPVRSVAADPAHPPAKAEKKEAVHAAPGHADKAGAEKKHAAEPANVHAADANAADSHAKGGHADKAPSPLVWTNDLALWTLITFVILCIVLRTFAWGPLAGALDAREAKIHGNLAHAEEARVKAEKMLADYQAKLATAQDEVLKTLAEARREAESTRQEILAQTEKDVAAVKQRALLEIERTKDAALNELFDHMAGTVANATEKVLGRTLTDSDQDRLVNEALVEFSRQQAS